MSEENQTKRPLSVFEVTSAIENRLSDPLLQNIVVIGEIIDYKVHPSSGHAYFSLTDKNSQAKKAVLKCTFFRGQNRLLQFSPKAGMEVAALGGISVYYQGGQYNFNVRKLTEIGKGNLWLKIQELKQKLVAEGVIDPEKRKPLPALPRKIGIVTGMGTAALRDIIKQVEDRYPHVDILFAPAMVQGDEAPDSIALALGEVSKPEYGCEVILLARGGGSPEDLMAFNHETVARAVHRCPLPVVSAIGHQIDHPISDDVADVAAATPTDGAKIILPVIEEKAENLSMLNRHLNNLLAHRFTSLREKLNRISEKPFFRNPYSLIEEYVLRLDERESRMSAALDAKLRKYREKLYQLKDISMLQEKNLTRFRYRFDQASERIHAFSPLATLKRGYAVVYQNDKLIRSADKVDLNSEIKIRMDKGSIYAAPSRMEEISAD